MSVTIRKVLLTVFLAGLWMAGAHAREPFTDNEVRVAVMTDLTGIYSDWGGQGMAVAAEMAIEDAGGSVAGKKIRLYVSDDRLDAKVALAEAERLRSEEHVDVIAGFVASNVALPVQAWAREHGVVTLVSGAASSDLTNKACSATGAHWTYDTYALANGSVNALVGDGADRWFFITADYAFGHILEAQAAAAVRANGRQVVGQVRAPYQGWDFSPQLRQAQQSGATMIALASAGVDTQRTIRQAYELGLSEHGQQVVGLLVFLTDIRSLGLYATQGLRFTTGFYWDYDDATRAWSQRYYQRTGAMPTMAQAGVYSSLSHYFKSIAAAGTDEGKAVVEKMKQLPVNDFFARNGVVRTDGRMVHDMYLVEVKRPSESKRAWDYLKVVKVIPGEAAFQPLSDSECPLVNQRRS
jgi:branched-chain amino acid transport system substrate-binding protein